MAKFDEKKSPLLKIMAEFKRTLELTQSKVSAIKDGPIMSQDTPVNFARARDINVENHLINFNQASDFQKNLYLDAILMNLKLNGGHRFDVYRIPASIDDLRFVKLKLTRGPWGTIDAPFPSTVELPVVYPFNFEMVLHQLAEQDYFGKLQTDVVLIIKQDEFEIGAVTQHGWQVWRHPFNVGDSEITFEYYPSSLARARQIYFRYQGNKYYMSLDGILYEYSNYDITEKTELAWQKDFEADDTTLIAETDLNQFKAHTQKPMLHLTLTPLISENQANLVVSKVGGQPYWPSQQTYPLDENGQAMILLAQLNFAQLPTLEEFPNHGILQFYITRNSYAYGADFDDLITQRNFRVIYHENITWPGEYAPKYQMDAELDKLPFDRTYQISGQRKLQALTTSAKEFEAEINQYYAQYRLKDDMNSVDSQIFEDQFIEKLQKDNFEYDHQLGGYPSFTQWDPRSVDSDYDVLLLQLGSSKDGTYWGDMGIANFFISHEKLAQLDFSDVVYTWDCY